jgi:hypothetical protein
VYIIRGNYVFLYLVSCEMLKFEVFRTENTNHASIMMFITCCH